MHNNADRDPSEAGCQHGGLKPLLSKNDVRADWQGITRRLPGCRYRERVSWQLEEFTRALTSVSPRTVDAYRADVAGFADWCERAGIEGPGDVQRLTLRRYLAFLNTRRYARRTVARKAASLRKYFRWLRRTGTIER